MDTDKKPIDDKALDSLSVAPARSQGDEPPTRSDAGSDASIEERLQKNPESKEARLDRGLDESMDASDPPASTQPVHNTGPAPSSGYDEEAERRRAQGNN